MNHPVTISELTKQIRTVIENSFSFVHVTGEISNFKNHSSGHFYFTLKDDKSQISANMWSSRNRYVFFTPENGMKVIVKGRITLFEAKGTYQIEVFEMQPAGEGELQVRFDRLKQKLFEEGLFSEDIKKSIPQFPEKVVVITSESGAALQDFLRVAQRRYPPAHLYLLPVTVQGAGSVESICSAIRTANNLSLEIDIIVIARGGGSIEDLWSFNEEKVAREIFNSRIPVVSAIGHEIDNTICDFAADLRAPTPSAAAEIIFPDRLELLKRLDEYSGLLSNNVDSKLGRLKRVIEGFSSNYYFKRSLDIFNEYKFRLDEMEKDIEMSVKNNFVNIERSLVSFEKLLNSLDPEQVLKRGFTIILKDDNVINRKAKIKENDNVEIKFYDGKSKAVISE
ncbi:MAG: exodeoxyribonuclease VII large subunit [Ignavibacteria bacterium]